MLFVEEWVDVVETLTDCFLRCPSLFQGLESWNRDLARAPRLGEGGLNLLCFVHILIVLDLDKAAEVEEERKMQEAAMLLKHQETPGGSQCELHMVFRSSEVFENLSQVSRTETTPASTSRTRRTSTSRSRARASTACAT